MKWFELKQKDCPILNGEIEGKIDSSEIEFDCYYRVIVTWVDKENPHDIGIEITDWETLKSDKYLEERFSFVHFCLLEEELITKDLSKLYSGIYELRLLENEKD